MVQVNYSDERTHSFKEIGAVIKTFRQKRNMSMQELGDLVGCSNGHISLIESGKRDPSFELLDKIFSALNLSVVISAEEIKVEDLAN